MLDRYTFIWKAIQKHGYKYDYRKVNYINSQTKVCIICPEHGEFWQRPNDHLMKKGCLKCGIVKSSVKQSMEFNEFITRAKKIHNDKYDYTEVKYVNNRTKICIICPKHGKIWITPFSHLQGQGCPKCNDNFPLTTESFSKKAKHVHNNKYDYSRVNYVNSQKKVCIICPIHGEFWQKPSKHLQGQGCPKCANEKNISELKIKGFLEKHFDNVKYQVKFDWLGKQSLDFYLPDYNIAIEYQGRQHFIDIHNNNSEFVKTCKRDKLKFIKYVKNNIKLIYFTYDKRNLPIKYNSDIITEEYELINFINTWKA